MLEVLSRVSQRVDLKNNVDKTNVLSNVHVVVKINHFFKLTLCETNKAENKPAHSGCNLQLWV